MSDFWIPKDPQNIPVRPLNKGMIRNMPSNALPEGAVWTAKNLWMIDNALQRRGNITPYALSSSGALLAMSFPARGATQLWRTNGTSAQVLWDTKYAYVLSSGALFPRNSVYAGGTRVSVGINSSTVYGIGATSWLNPTNTLMAGDYISFAGGTGVRRFKILAINTSNQITIEGAPTAAASGAYVIKRTLKALYPYYVDHCFCDNKVIFADGYRPLYYFDGTVFGRYITGSVGSTTFQWRPRTICFFNNRLWAGCIDEAGTLRRQTIRWSLTSDHTNFRDAGGGDSQWKDLPYHREAITKLLPLGNLLACYLGDGLYLGVPTNIPTLPVDFDSGKVETGGIGLVGVKAVASFLGAHFFVGQDDIYMVQSKGIQRIGSAVVKETIRKCSYIEAVKVAVDPARERVCFAFPESSESFVKIWSYFYKSGAWTYDEAEGTSLDITGGSSPINWDNWTTYMVGPPYQWDTDLGDWPSWDQIYKTSGSSKLIIGTVAGQSFSFNSDGSVDNMGSSSPIPVILETGDVDYNDPDSDKTWLRISLKLGSPVTSNLTFAAYTSTNRGNTWKSVGNLVIYAGTDEGYVNFRTTGSIFRFKLTSSENIAPYSMEEVVIRVRGRGLETRAVSA